MTVKLVHGLDVLDLHWLDVLDLHLYSKYSNIGFLNTHCEVLTDPQLTCRWAAIVSIDKKYYKTVRFSGAQRNSAAL